MYRKYGKRALDILCGIIALLLLCVPILLIAAWVKIETHNAALLRQKRVGKDKEEITIYKFRAAKDTRIGNFLRKTHLDEIAQFINILTGELSLVGPRPAYWQEYELITLRDQNDANSIKPGLIDPHWRKRDNPTAKERAETDGKYAEEMSFATDARRVIGKEK